MKNYSIAKDLTPFLCQLLAHKRESVQWCLLHTFCHNGTQNAPPVHEIIQFLSFYFTATEVHILMIEDRVELFLAARQTNHLDIKKCEKDFADNFSNTPVKLEILEFTPSGFDVLTRAIAQALPTVPNQTRVLMTRLKRNGNCIMILDDDAMVSSQLEKILSPLAHVITLSNGSKFFETYQEYAPDILFLDIHLRHENGAEILRQLKSNTDPHAYVVMISSDTIESTVIDVKSAGANGFIVKPFRREKVIQHLTLTPTYIPRNIVKS